MYGVFLLFAVINMSAKDADMIMNHVATGILFGLGMLHKEDLRTIDVTTLIFLTAAFSIGGVMKSCGAADKVFGVLQGIFPT